MIWKELFC